MEGLRGAVLLLYDQGPRLALGTLDAAMARARLGLQFLTDALEASPDACGELLCCPLAYYQWPESSQRWVHPGVLRDAMEAKLVPLRWGAPRQPQSRGRAARWLAGSIGQDRALLHRTMARWLAYLTGAGGYVAAAEAAFLDQLEAVEDPVRAARRRAERKRAAQRRVAKAKRKAASLAKIRAELREAQTQLRAEIRVVQTRREERAALRAAVHALPFGRPGAAADVAETASCSGRLEKAGGSVDVSSPLVGAEARASSCPGRVEHMSPRVVGALEDLEDRIAGVDPEGLLFNDPFGLGACREALGFEEEWAWGEEGGGGDAVGGGAGWDFD